MPAVLCLIIIIFCLLGLLIIGDGQFMDNESIVEYCPLLQYITF